MGSSVLATGALTIDDTNGAGGGSIVSQLVEDLAQALMRGWYAYLAVLVWLILCERLTSKRVRVTGSARARLALSVFEAVTGALILFLLFPKNTLQFGEEYATWLSFIVLPHFLLPGLAVCAAWTVRRHPLLMLESFPFFCLVWPLTLFAVDYHEYPMHLYSAIDFHQGLPCICAAHAGVSRWPYYLLRTLMQMCESTMHGMVSATALYGLSSLILRVPGSEYARQANSEKTVLVEKWLWRAVIWFWAVFVLWIAVGLSAWFFGVDTRWFIPLLLLVPAI
ncbi:MAG TPA: hypothetical protein PKO06_24460, partial [Candidatus Ozemobacteraceae bacterium]|nr:hypothetical protein [Candidatus Ozemobacteraceae bacterium]